jgi:hypothetical protein
MTADFTPDREFADALEDFTAAQDALNDARDHLRLMVAKALKEPPEPTNKQVAALLPWSEETVRGIAREYGVKPKRKPTVKSIKPAKRTKPTN